jgi:hypothetical protein
MDDRKPPESNVVRLRRDGEPDKEERRRLARTIFASEDDVGTFSRGNLLLPPKAPPHEEPPAEPDPFFEQLQGPDRSTTPASALGDRTTTDTHHGTPQPWRPPTLAGPFFAATRTHALAHPRAKT